MAEHGSQIFESVHSRQNIRGFRWVLGRYFVDDSGLQLNFLGIFRFGPTFSSIFGSRSNSLVLGHCLPEILCSQHYFLVIYSSGRCFSIIFWFGRNFSSIYDFRLNLLVIPCHDGILHVVGSCIWFMVSILRAWWARGNGLG